MTLKYFEGKMDGFKNNTDEFIVLIGYDANILQPLPAGQSYWNIAVLDPSSNVIDGVGEIVQDNGLTQTYVQISTGNFYKKHLLIPPSCSISVYETDALINTYGQFIQGKLEEVIHLL